MTSTEMAGSQPGCATANTEMAGPRPTRAALTTPPTEDVDDITQRPEGAHRRPDDMSVDLLSLTPEIRGRIYGYLVDGHHDVYDGEPTRAKPDPDDMASLMCVNHTINAEVTGFLRGRRGFRFHGIRSLALFIRDDRAASHPSRPSDVGHLHLLVTSRAVERLLDDFDPVRLTVRGAPRDVVVPGQTYREFRTYLVGMQVKAFAIDVDALDGHGRLSDEAMVRIMRRHDHIYRALPLQCGPDGTGRLTVYGRTAYAVIEEDRTVTPCGHRVTIVAC